MAFPFLDDLVNPILGTNWTIPVPMFGLFVAISIVISAWVMKQEVRRREFAGTLKLGSSDLVMDLATLGAIAGIVGARLFHILEYPAQFAADPVAMILTRGGFSIYGGLIVGVLASVIFLRRRAVPILPMLDAVAPSLMLGYAIGRIGCQVSGDGDWGRVANMDLKPDWMPDFLWAQSYDGNIAGVILPPPGVYPTPMYETGMALVAFLILWGLRVRVNAAGFLFCAYLMLSGFERLLIEKVRVNPKYGLFGFDFTQAEAISMILVVAGFCGILVALRSVRLFPKLLFSLVTLSLLSACVQL